MASTRRSSTRRPSCEGTGCPGRSAASPAECSIRESGAALWFVDGADPERIAGTIGAFEEHRHADLWSGTGLAAAYAGCIDEDGLALLASLAGGYRLHLAQGAAFAAKARIRAGNLGPHTELACSVICGVDAAAAARITDHALEHSGGGDTAADYDRWRGEIRTQLAA